MKTDDKLTNDSRQQQVGAQLVLFPKKRKEMSGAERYQALHAKLYQKAKQEKNFGFYILYDKIFLNYVLEEAWERVKSNGGAAGIDEVTVGSIERSGVKEFLSDIKEDLRRQTYRPTAVKRVMIRKPTGGERGLGIPTVRDRVVQTACLLVIEPIFEADFEEHSYGFRPQRSAQQAITQLKTHLQAGKSEVYDADVSKYFDSIPHDKLQIALKERIKDQRVIKLLSRFLKAPVRDGRHFKGGKGRKIGTPQGSPISPLLGNIYLHLLDRIISSPTSIFKQYGVVMVRYADDFVLLGKRLETVVIDKLKGLLARMGLTINEDKSQHLSARQTPFNFLGFVIRYDRSLKAGGIKYWNIKPSEKSIKSIRQKLNMALKEMGHYQTGAVVNELNKIMRGWLNYFEIKGVSYPAVAKFKLETHLRERLFRYFNRKSQRKSKYRYEHFSTLVDKHGLIEPTKYSPATRLVGRR